MIVARRKALIPELARPVKPLTFSVIGEYADQAHYIVPQTNFFRPPLVLPDVKRFRSRDGRSISSERTLANLAQEADCERLNYEGMRDHFEGLLSDYRDLLSIITGGNTVVPPAIRRQLDQTYAFFANYSRRMQQEGRMGQPMGRHQQCVASFFSRTASALEQALGEIRVEDAEGETANAQTASLVMRKATRPPARVLVLSTSAELGRILYRVSGDAYARIRQVGINPANGAARIF